MHQFYVPGWLMVAAPAPVLLAALWKGGWRERAVSLVMGFELVTETDAFLHWRVPEWYATGLDVVILLVCLLVAWKSDRYWTIVASSFALLSVISHPFYLARGVTSWAYYSLERVWLAAIVLALLAGVWAVLRPPPPAAANEA